MHEMSLVRSIVNIVLEECAGKGITKVEGIDLVVGQLHDMLDAYVPDLFRYLARGTVAEDAQVNIARIPMRVRCRDCGEIFALGDERACPRCGARRRYALFSGSEFRIDSIEVEGEGRLAGVRGPFLSAIDAGHLEW